MPMTGSDGCLLLSENAIHASPLLAQSCTYASYHQRTFLVETGLYPFTASRHPSYPNPVKPRADDAGGLGRAVE